MQNHDWNDLKFFLALYRAGKLKEAARTLGVSETTVTRRIRELEQSLETKLFLRSANGRYEPTDEALQILTFADTIEAGNTAIRAISGKSSDHVAGCVRISSVPIIVNRFLVPNLAALKGIHPLLTIELVPTSSNLDLSKREADLAVRFARPLTGGLRTKAQKLGEMSFAAYAARSISPDQRETLGWITYDDAHSDLPQARWLSTIARSPELRATVRVADSETALEAVAQGLGKTLLPCAIADQDSRLQALKPEKGASYPDREVWLLTHVDQTSRLSIAAAKDWLSGLGWA